MSSSAQRDASDADEPLDNDNGDEDVSLLPAARDEGKAKHASKKKSKSKSLGTKVKPQDSSPDATTAVLPTAATSAGAADTAAHPSHSKQTSAIKTSQPVGVDKSPLGLLSDHSSASTSGGGYGGINSHGYNRSSGGSGSFSVESKKSLSASAISHGSPASSQQPQYQHVSSDYHLFNATVASTTATSTGSSQPLLSASTMSTASSGRQLRYHPRSGSMGSHPVFSSSFDSGSRSKSRRGSGSLARSILKGADEDDDLVDFYDSGDDLSRSSISHEAETEEIKGTLMNVHAPVHRFYWEFPDSWESALRWFDDPLIRACQYFENKLVFYFNFVLLAFTAIETGIAAPFILHMIGLDACATIATYVILLLCAVSQIPKRFIWRYRPYMVERARKVRRDMTSSFPSRAVTCAVSYSFLICTIVNYVAGRELTDLQGWMYAVIIAAALALSFSRVNFGAHYPSDCFVGFFQGCLCVVLGASLYHLDIQNCNSCMKGECYAPSNDASRTMTWTSLDNLNWVIILVSSFAGLLITVAVNLKPLEFWSKCQHVFGILFPCIVFQTSFLCPPLSHDGSALPDPGPAKWYSYLLGIVCALLITLIGMKIKGTLASSIIAYCIMFVVTFGSLFAWRISNV